MNDNTAQNAAGVQIEIFDIHVDFFISYLTLSVPKLVLGERPSGRYLPEKIRITPVWNFGFLPSSPPLQHLGSLHGVAGPVKSEQQAFG